jgi:aspartate aminotransferase-like enzyme
METYEGGGHAYHATLPTDALTRLRDVMLETERLRFRQGEGAPDRTGPPRSARCSKRRGFVSVAAPGFQAPGVVVSYTDDPDMQNGRKFMAQGLQIAAGVPLQVDEPADFRSFRIGLFGLDKLQNVDRTVRHLEQALDRVL